MNGYLLSWCWEDEVIEWVTAFGWEYPVAPSIGGPVLVGGRDLTGHVNECGCTVVIGVGCQGLGDTFQDALDAAVANARDVADSLARLEAH